MTDVTPSEHGSSAIAPKITGAIGALILALSSPVHAEWLGGSGEDPMTDQKWAAATTEFSYSGLPAAVFKCWAGGALQVGVAVGPYEASASYSPIVKMQMRVDKEPPVELLAAPVDLNNMLTLVATGEDNPDLVLLLKDILNSEHRVALSVGSASFQTDVRGTSKWIGAMFKVCGLADDDDAKAKPEAKGTAR